jgi:hypothetical protein
LAAGPITLFDKSFLQQLSLDESVWFDHFFITNICPIFYIETLADLEKNYKEGRNAENEVKKIASKFPEMHGTPNTFHITLCAKELLSGSFVPMTGQILFSSGKRVGINSELSDVFNYSEEVEAFLRWQKEQFSEVERLFAKRWRANLNKLNIIEVKEKLIKLGINGSGCRSLEEAKAKADDIIKNSNKTNLFHCALMFLNIPREDFNGIYERWKILNYPPLDRHAPYTTYLLTIEIFFYIALDGNLIPSQSSTRQDISYLFYLPFCAQFVSSDRLHSRCANLFLRHDQKFTWGPDLKADLALLNSYYLDLHRGQKLFISDFARYPPLCGDFYISKIWDSFFPNWRLNVLKTEDLTPIQPREDYNKIVEYKEKALIADPVIGPNSEVKGNILVRRIKKEKGSWYQLPSHCNTIEEVTDVYRKYKVEIDN